MAYLISFNSSKIIPNGYNNTFEHNFNGSSISLTDTEIAVHSINMYNSVFNIDSTNYQNSTLILKMPTGSTTSNINISFPDGLYSYADMTLYIQSKLREAGAYLIDSDGNERHYIQINENRVYYAGQVDLAPVPTSLPSGWTRPSTGLYSTGGSGLPTTSRVPILSITNANFGKLIGFDTGDYPSSAQTTLQTFLSNTTPQVHPVSAYELHCSMINNPYSNPSDVLTTFDTQGTSAGQLISYRPNEYTWVNVADGAYPSIKLVITDQNGKYVRLRDPDIQITLAIRQRQKNN